jgi:hypothetical protein
VENLRGVLRADFERWNNEILREQRARGEEDRPLEWGDYLQRRGLHERTLNEFLARTARANLLKRMVVGYWEVSTPRADAWGIFVRARREAEDMQARLLQGESFELLASRHSMDARTRERRGLIGTVWPKDGRLDPALDEPFWKLEDGQTSGVIEVSDGFWIVRRKSSIRANLASFPEHRESLLHQPNVDANRFRAWQKAVSAGGRYAFERRMPGWDVRADEE